MPITCDCTAATASADTVETSLGTVTLPPNATKILAIGVGSPGGAGITTLEGVTGIFRVQCNGLDVTPGKFPIQGPQVLGTGGTFCDFMVWPVDWSPAANLQITFYITMDMALTVNSTFRGFVVYEKS